MVWRNPIPIIRIIKSFTTTLTAFGIFLSPIPNTARTLLSLLDIKLWPDDNDVDDMLIVFEAAIACDPATNEYHKNMNMARMAIISKLVKLRCFLSLITLLMNGNRSIGMRIRNEI